MALTVAAGAGGVAVHRCMAAESRDWPTEQRRGSVRSGAERRESGSVERRGGVWWWWCGRRRARRGQARPARLILDIDHVYSTQRDSLVITISTTDRRASTAHWPRPSCRSPGSVPACHPTPSPAYRGPSDWLAHWPVARSVGRLTLYHCVRRRSSFVISSNGFRSLARSLVRWWVTTRRRIRWVVEINRRRCGAALRTHWAQTTSDAGWSLSIAAVIVLLVHQTKPTVLSPASAAAAEAWDLHHRVAVDNSVHAFHYRNSAPHLLKWTTVQWSFFDTQTDSENNKRERKLKEIKADEEQKNSEKKVVLSVSALTYATF